MHVSLSQLIRPYTGTSYEDLPADVQAEVSKDFSADAWNNSSPTGRADWAERSDAWHEADSAVSTQLRSVHGYWFNLQHEILSTEREIANVQSLAAGKGSEGDSATHETSSLRGTLAALHKRWYQPDDPAAMAQIASARAEASRSPTVLNITRALQFLSESTGLIWTEAQFLALVSKSDIPLYAEVPPWAPMYVTQLEDFGLRQRPFMAPGRNVLAILSPEQIQEVWVTGQSSSSTWVSGKPFSVGTEFVSLEEPVTFQRHDIRLTQVELMQILKKWEESRQPIAPLGLPTGAAGNSNEASAEEQPRSNPHFAQTLLPESVERVLRPTPEWMSKAQEVAKQYIDRHRANDLYPTLADVCKHVEGTLRASGICGTHGRPVSAEYIQRNALGGDWWRRNKP